MKLTTFSIYLSFLVVVITGCATSRKPPPTISLDEPVKAQQLPEPPKPVAVVEVPKPLPLPDQLKPVPAAPDAQPPPPAPPTGRVSPQERVEQANAEARVTPTPEGYVNAIQVWPYSDGALYQVYTSPSRVTVIALQAGEDLVTVAAGDTVRWIVGDTTSGSGVGRRVNVMVKPTRSGLKTNLVITTNRRTYLVELASTEAAWMASVSWDYPQDALLALQPGRRPPTPPHPLPPRCRWMIFGSAMPSPARIRRGSRCAPSMTVNAYTSSFRPESLRASCPHCL